MLLLPPRSTLFPYTTLFRSLVVAKEKGIRDVGVAERGPTADTDVGNPALEMLGAVGDRKSTRLNSSHGYISYAVFCLKKKKRILTQKDKRCERRYLARYRNF